MPLVVSKLEWKRIEKWRDRDASDADAARREHVAYLNAASRAMTKEWPNSLENVNKRNEEQRQARLLAAEQSNNRFYKRYVKRKHEEQERLMSSARDTVFKNKDAPKMLLSAVIETMIQKERIEQIKFLEEQKRLEAEQKRQEADDVIRRAEEWHKISALHHQRRREANKKHQREIVEQAKEVAERKRNEHQAELELQKIDNIKAKEQIEAIKKFEDDLKAGEKARIWSDMERSRVEEEQLERGRRACSALESRLLRAVLRARARTDTRRAQTERDLKEERLRVLEAISQKLETGESARVAKDLEILKKAVAEKEAIASARRRAETEKQQKSQQERIEAREDFLRDEARRLRDLGTVRQWEIMNRFKNEEVSKDYQEQVRREKERKVKEYREDILKQWKEREDREASELAERRYFYGSRAQNEARVADDQLTAHAQLLVGEAHARGRPDHALRAAVRRYCKLHRLRPPPGLLQPPRPASPAADSHRRDGLRQPEPIEPAETPQSPGVHARAGRADQENIQLPPIRVVPCKTESHRCDLKK